MDGSWWFLAVDLCNALDPVVQGFALLLRITNTSHSLQVLCDRQTIQGQTTNLMVQAASKLTTGLTVVCLVRVLSCRSRTVGSDCLARGSSTTNRPAFSVFPSGLITCHILHRERDPLLELCSFACYYSGCILNT